MTRYPRLRRPGRKAFFSPPCTPASSCRPSPKRTPRRSGARRRRSTKASSFVTGSSEPTSSNSSKAVRVAKYGEKLLERLSVDLRKREIAAGSPQMLERMRQFYLTYPQVGGAISSPVVRKSKKSQSPTGELSILPISAPVVRKSSDPLPSPLSPAQVLQFSWTHLVERLRVGRSMEAGLLGKRMPPRRLVEAPAPAPNWFAALRTHRPLQK